MKVRGGGGFFEVCLGADDGEMVVLWGELGRNVLYDRERGGVVVAVSRALGRRVMRAGFLMWSVRLLSMLEVYGVAEGDEWLVVWVIRLPKVGDGVVVGGLECSTMIGA
ncbi:hypothetical protein Tco_0863994 [Tanacetum coccineum]